MKKKKVGQISTELMEKMPEAKHTVQDQMSEQLGEFEAEVWKAVDEGIKNYDSDFFLVVITKKERLMHNVIRNYFFTRRTCPSPEYDQTVYRYYKKHDALNYVWTVPDKEACEYLIRNPKDVYADEMDLLRFVNDFYNGTLLKVAMKFNKEEKEDNRILKIMES